VRNSNTVILQAVTEALETAILPVVGTESGKSAAQLSLILLRLLLGRETGLVDLVDTEIESIGSLLAKMRTVTSTGEARGASAHRLEAMDGALGFAGNDRYGRSHMQLLQGQTQLAATAEELIARGQSTDAESGSPSVDPLLVEMATRELAFTRAVLSFVQSPPNPADPKESSGLTRDTLERYLTQRFPERRNLVVTDMAGSGFSMSKQILFFSIRDDSGKKEDLVLRQEKPVRWMEADCTLVKNEYALIQCVYDMGLPVPEPLWLETGSTLGPDFMVMRKVGGKQVGEPFKAYQPLSEELIMQMAEILASLHGAGLEPFESFFRTTGQAALLNMSLKEATLHRINVWKTYFEHPNQFPSPGKAWLFDWLTRNVPNYTERPVMVHGDFNIHNLLADNGHITTCLDWEWGHAGSALEDLYNIRPHVEKYSSWERFYQHYQAHGGPDVQFNEEVLNYNRCLTNTIYSASGSKLACNIAKREVNDLPAVFGANYYALEFHRVALEASLKKH